MVLPKTKKGIIAIMKLSIASDHAGFELKNWLVENLKVQGYEVIDRGCPSIESVDYPDYARFVCEDMQKGNCDFGILVCYTGIGMSIYANKFRGIRAALVTNLESAYLTRQHNNSNIICLSGRFTEPGDASKFVTAFINEKFQEGRHLRRINKISEKEKER